VNEKFHVSGPLHAFDFSHAGRLEQALIKVLDELSRGHMRDHLLEALLVPKVHKDVEQRAIAPSLENGVSADRVSD